MGVDGGDSAELLETDELRYPNLQFEEDVLARASGLGLTQHAGVIRGLIQDPLAGVEREAEKQSNAAHGCLHREYRGGRTQRRHNGV